MAGHGARPRHRRVAEDAELQPPRTHRGEKTLNFTSLSVGREGAEFKDNLVFVLDTVGNFRQALTLLLFI